MWAYPSAVSFDRRNTMTCLFLALVLTACGSGSDDSANLQLQSQSGASSVTEMASMQANAESRDSTAPTVADVQAAASTPAPNAAPGQRVYPNEQVVTRKPGTSPLGAKPAYRVTVDFADIGTKAVRVTDPGAFGISRRINRHAYAKQQPWNSDGSRIMLHYQWPAVLVDGRTFQFIKRFDPPSDPLWSNVDPDVIYGVLADQSRFVKYQVSSGTQTTQRTFGAYSSIHIGGGEGNLSKDGRLIALIGKRTGGVDVLVYDVLNDSVVSFGRFDGQTGPHGDVDSASVSPSGRYVLVGVQRGSDRGWDLYDAATMRFARRLVNGQSSHADMGYSTAGDEVLVTAANGRPAVVSVRLSDGVQREELSSAHMTWFNHISCRNNDRPGWCYISSYDEGNGQYMIRQLFALKLNGTGTVQRFAPAIFADTGDSEEDYARSPMAVPNRDGTLILFASDWADGSGNARIDGYVAGMRLP